MVRLLFRLFMSFGILVWLIRVQIWNAENCPTTWHPVCQAMTIKNSRAFDQRTNMMFFQVQFFCPSSIFIISVVYNLNGISSSSSY